MEPRIFKTTKRASFGVTRSGYDADQPANLSQWQKETMGELIPLEGKPDYIVSLKEFLAVAVLVAAVVALVVSL